MRQRKCKNCGKIFNVPGGREQYLCPECSAEAKKNSVIRERICKNCGVAFLGYPRSFYCPACAIERRKQKRRERGNRPYRPLGSVDICANCGKEYVVKSGLQRYCPECAEKVVAEKIKAHKREYMADNKEKSQARKSETRGKRYVCVICGKEYEKHTTEVTCSPECHKEYTRRKQNIADIRRGKRKLPSDQRYNSGLPQSGVVGVTYRRQSGKWQASVKGKYVGVYETVERAKEAIENYKSEEK